MTTKPTKTELENYISRFLNKSMIISTHLVCVMWPDYQGADVVWGGGGGGGALTFRKGNEN